MKTNVSIKFNSVEEYREIEQKLEELGYVNDKEWNKHYSLKRKGIVLFHENLRFYILDQNVGYNKNYKTYNSLQEFLND